MDEKKSKRGDPAEKEWRLGEVVMTLGRATDGKGWKLIAGQGDWRLVHFSPDGFLRLEHIHDDGWAHGVYHKTGLCMKCNKEAPQELQAMWLVGK